MDTVNEQLQEIVWQSRTSNMLVWRHKAQTAPALGHIVLHNSSVSAFVMNKFIGFYETEPEAMKAIEDKVRERLANEYLAEQEAEQAARTLADPGPH